jgi:hypothetical protein
MSLSNEAIKRIGPHLKSCAESLYSEHEDVEIGRCFWKHLNTSCTTAKDAPKLFFNNFKKDTGYFDNLGYISRRTANRAITLHANKEPKYQILTSAILIRESMKTLRKVTNYVKSHERPTFKTHKRENVKTWRSSSVETRNSSSFYLAELNKNNEKGAVFNAMSEWRFYTSVDDRVNQPVANPWRSFFTTLFQESSSRVFKDERPEIEIPVFYYRRNSAVARLHARDSISNSSSVQLIFVKMEYAPAEVKVSSTGDVEVLFVIPIIGKSKALASFLENWSDHLSSQISLLFAIMGDEKSIDETVKIITPWKQKHSISVNYIWVLF